MKTRKFIAMKLNPNESLAPCENITMSGSGAMSQSMAQISLLLYDNVLSRKTGKLKRQSKAERLISMQIHSTVNHLPSRRSAESHNRNRIISLYGNLILFSRHVLAMVLCIKLRRNENYKNRS
jgi:hypothetical protein